MTEYEVQVWGLRGDRVFHLAEDILQVIDHADERSAKCVGCLLRTHLGVVLLPG